MEVILLEKVANLGNLGDRVEVKPGYGRNYLVPQGKAVRATKDNIEYFESQRAELEAASAERVEKAKARAAGLDGNRFEIAANASPEGKLYGSVGTREIAEALSAAGHPVEKSEVILDEGVLRETGEFEIALQLHADVAATITIVIVEDTTQ